MKFLHRIGKILTHGCVYYTVASLALYTGGMLASGIEREWIPTLKMMYIVLVFSVLFAAVNEVVWNTRLAGILKILIHYAATTVIFYVMFILWGGYNTTPSSVLVILLAYTLIYVAASLLVYFFHYVSSLKKSSTAAYTSQFAKEPKKK